jgi:hypothetical protein
MSADKLRGGCLCRTVRYECEAPVSSAALCHCESCRRASGAHVIAWLAVRTEAFRFTHGSPREFVSSPPVRRSFCADCGSPLTYRHRDSPETVDVTIATLDDPNAVVPEYHVWMEDALRWEDLCDTLPKYRTSHASGMPFKRAR